METTTVTPDQLHNPQLTRYRSAAQRSLAGTWALWTYLLINVLLLPGALLAPPPLSLVLGAVIPVLAVMAIAVGIHWHKPVTTNAWLLIGAGVAVAAAASVTATVTRTVFDVPAPEWIGPVAGVLSLPAFIAGLAVLGRRIGRGDTADMLDALMLALATFLVLFALVLHPALPPGNGAVAVAVIFPLGALLLFGMAAWVALSVGFPNVSIALLLLAACVGVAVLVSLLIPGLSTETLGDHGVTRWLFIGHLILLGCAALHPSLGRTPARLPHNRDPVSRRRMALLAALAVVAPLAWGGEIARTTGLGHLSVTIPLLMSAVLLLLLVARLGLTAGVAHRRAGELSQRSDDLANAVHEQEVLQRQLRYQALHDPLTGLANRVVLAERMEWALSRRSGGEYALAVIDIDRFKDVNDTFGHAIGDQLLVEVSHRLLATMPSGGTLARFGGDEFAVLLEDISTPEAASWGEQVRQTLRRPYRVADQDLYLSASMGLLTTELTRPTPTPSEALRDADLALYSAKAAGKDRVEVYRPELRTARTDYRRVQSGLQRALANDEMALHYQPVVNLATSRIVAVEALLRWAPSGRPAQLPGTFIAVAEDTGLIGPIGAWVMRRACRDAQPWYDKSGVAVTVNVSPRQLEAPDFADVVLDALGATGLPGQALIVEITETSLVATSTANQTMDQLHRLRAHDVRVAIDDFGTGYSSLANVARLPVDIVKIDSSFVQNTGPPGNGSKDWAFTRAILNMVKALRLMAVAEGVETLEQAEALRRLRCPLAQGFLFARPMPPRVFAQVLADAVVTPGRLAPRAGWPA